MPGNCFGRWLLCRITVCIPILLLLCPFAQQAWAQGPGSPGSLQSSATPAAELRVFDPSLIDISVDPCKDFYQFSCGNWQKRNPLPADQTSYGRFVKVAERNRLHLKQILEQASTPTPNRSAGEQKIGDEYASCMDAPAVNEKGFASLQPELRRIDALWNKAGLPLLLAHLHRIGVNAFFLLGASPSYSDSSTDIASFSAAGLGLPERDYYTRTDPTSVKQRQQYLAHVEKVLEISGETKNQAASDAAAVLELETALAKASLTITEQRDPQQLNHQFELEEFGRTMHHFSLTTYVSAVGAPQAGRINVTEPKFFSAFDALLKRASLQEIQAYLRWCLVHTFSGTSLPDNLEREEWDFYAHTLNGAEQQQDRWKRCISRVDRELGEALGQVYVARYFSPADKQRTLAMTLEIERALERDIDTLDWMSAATKVRAKEKLHGVMNKIGYPERWLDYSNLSIVRGDALGNQMRAQEFEHAREMAKIGKPVDRLEWEMTPPTVNAEYDAQENEVNFPAGILQPPFFNALEDDAANYGDMGSTIGHELTHGFDDEGRQFDAAGNLKDWWTKDDAQQFTERASCMVKQYDAIEPVPGVHLNGKLTLGENLADLGGLWLAWLAWQEKAQTSHVDLAAKTDGYTPEQRFWVAYGQQWCSQTRPEQLRTQAETDPHAPDESRTNAVLQDLPQFAKSFNCKASQKMVAAKPCRVW
jgi:endothelin-converting enzyme/putative endopeptidase